MKITRNRVLLETTNMVAGMLEQGGISGRIESYPLVSVMAVAGMTREELAAADPEDAAPAYVGYVSIREAIARELGDGLVIRRGHRIQ